MLGAAEEAVMWSEPCIALRTLQGHQVFLSHRELLVEPLGILAYPIGLLFCGLVSCIRGRRPRLECGNANLGTRLCVTYSSLEVHSFG